MSNSYLYGKCLVPADNLDLCSPEVQKVIMEGWFRERYEDPAENAPWAEGEYHYIWGGPHDAHEVLSEEFGESVKESVIEELAQELWDDNPEWASIPTYEDTCMADFTHLYYKFESAMGNIKLILTIQNIPAKAENTFYRLLYANVVSALEVYLSGNFINRVLSNGDLMREFVKTTDEFKKEKILFSEIYQKIDGMKTRIIDMLGKFSWHRLDRIENMYSDTFGINFPKNEEIYKAIQIRHDIVHRNGENKKGEIIPITKDDVSRIIESVLNFVEGIDQKIIDKFGREKEYKPQQFRSHAPEWNSGVE